MSTRLSGAFGALILFSMAAVAGDVEDCRQARRADLRLKACTQIIDGAAFSSDEKALAYRFRAESRSDAGALTDAIADFSKALAIKPDHGPAYAGRGLARFTAGDSAGAIADYNEAVNRSPRSSALLVTRGHIRLASGDPDGAIEDLTQAIRLTPNNPVALNNRGLAYRRKGELAMAEADYTAALALNPIFALAYANRGHVREALGHKQEAIEDLRQALLLDPSQAEVRQSLKRLGESDTYTAEGDRRVLQGQALVEANCTRCHAVGTSGESPNAKAPEFRNLNKRHAQLALREPLTRGIAAQHDEMPHFKLSNSEIDAIVAYISSMAMQR